MYCKFRAGCLLFLAVLLLAGCSRKPAAKPDNQKIAILRFENLGSDFKTDWIGRAFSEIIADELGNQAIPGFRLQTATMAMGARPASSPGISSQRSAALASGADRLGYGEYTVRGDRLEARLTIEDPSTGKMVQSLSVEVPAANVIDAATTLARQISAGATPYATTNARAVEAYVTSLEATDGAAAVKSLEEAIAADAGFLAPYRTLAQIKARQQDRDGAIALLETARTRTGSAAEKARIETEIAMLRGDAGGREQSLAAVAKADPKDPAAWRSLSEIAMARKNYRQAADALAKLVELEPENKNGWNQYGYALAYTGDLAGGLKALQRYQTLSPKEANPLDSMGDIHVVHGRLREAEAYYLEAAKKDPNFLNGAGIFKAAMARLMTGDVAGADSLAKQYVEARKAAKDPAASYREAEWAWTTGRRKAAYAQMEAVARAAEATSRELASRSYSDLAGWSLLMGDREAAARMATKALSLASQTSAVPAIVTRFLAQPPASASEWKARADRQFPGAQANTIREVSLVYALLLDKDFASAAVLLKQLAENGVSTPESDLQILLAWALIETGKLSEAEPLLRWNPIPPPGSTGPFFGLHFPRLFHLRGVLAEKAGRSAEAREQQKLFEALSSNDSQQRR